MAEEARTPAEVETDRLPIVMELAALVRHRSRAEAKLTPMAAVEVDGEPLGDRQESLIAEILAAEACGDIRVLRSSSGAAYLYSSDHMSEGYARILLRVEEGDPCEQVASVVREESELYPRPTPMAQFSNPLFGVDPDRLRQLVQEMLQLKQYSDIKLITASTGAEYLYSDRFLDRDWAQSLVEWEEVGRYESP